MAKSTKWVFDVKDPDAHQVIRNEALREMLTQKYAEHGEYFRIEIDMATGKGRLLPVSEWA